MHSIFAQMQDQIGIREPRRLYVLAFGRSIHQFAKPTTKLRIENVLNVVGALTHKGVKLLPKQIPFIYTTIARHTLCAQTN